MMRMETNTSPDLRKFESQYSLLSFDLSFFSS